MEEVALTDDLKWQNDEFFKKKKLNVNVNVKHDYK